VLEPCTLRVKERLVCVEWLLLAPVYE